MIQIDEKLCKACGLCGRICPRYVPETVTVEGGKRTVVSERADICIDCGQCMAICPNGSIHVDGIAPDDLLPVPRLECTPEQLESLFAHRRSVRRYKDKPVPREVLDRIVDAVRWSPTASPRGATGLIIIDRPEILKRFSVHLYKLYDKVEQAFGNPIARFVMTRRVGKRKVATLRDHVMPGMRWYKRWREEGRSDEILRDCPVVMLFHAATREPSTDESCIIAAWQAVLMAEALGLGTCFNGLIPPPCNRGPELRQMLGLPDDHEVFAALTMGYPKYVYESTIRRPLSGVRYVELSD